MAGVGERRLIAQTQRAQGHFGHLLFNRWADETRLKRLPASMRREQEPVPKPAKDLIPAWNIAPGDRVLVLAGDKSMKHRIGTVAGVRRKQNRLLMQEAPFMRSKRRLPRLGINEPVSNKYTQVGIDYSNLALVLDTDPLQEVVRVATRLKAKRLHYDRESRKWVWHRVPEQIRLWNAKEGHWVREAEAATSQATVDRLAQQTAGLTFEEESAAATSAPEAVSKKQHPRAPWPTEGVKPPRGPSFATDTETNEKTVLADTFRPELHPWKRLLPELSVPYSEFGNPLSKARRQERWNLKNRDDRWKKIKRSAWTDRPLLGIKWPKGMLAGLKRPPSPVAAGAGSAKPARGPVA